MNFLRLLLFSSLLGTLLAGCEIFPSSDRRPWFPPRYYLVQVTNYRGELIANWVAHGFVRRSETGYQFRAVERFAVGPFPQRMKYPEGHMVEVTGPNIVITRCAQPEWLYDREHAW